MMKGRFLHCSFNVSLDYVHQPSNVLNSSVGSQDIKILFKPKHETDQELKTYLEQGTTITTTTTTTTTRASDLQLDCPQTGSALHGEGRIEWRANVASWGGCAAWCRTRPGCSYWSWRSGRDR